MNLDYDDEFDNPQKLFFLDTNLNSPVLFTEIVATKQLFNDYIVSKSSTVPENRRGSKPSELMRLEQILRLTKISISHLQKSEMIMPRYYEEIERDMLCSQYADCDDYKRAKNLSLIVEEALIAGLLDRGLPSEEVSGTSEKLCTTAARPFRLAYSRLCDIFGKAEYRIKNDADNWFTSTVGKVRIAFNSKYAFVVFREQVYYSSLNQILMIKDKISTRFMLLEHVAPLGLDITLEKQLLKLFSWQDKTLSMYDNEAYNILKAVEPLFKTRLSHVVDNIFGSDTAYNRMKIKMYDKEKALKTNELNTTPQIDELCAIIESIDSVRSLVELFGCAKSCGHPLIDAELGGYSAAEEACSDDTTSIFDAQKLRNTFCHTVLVAYVKQHGVWPRLIHSDPSTSLRALNNKQERFLTYTSYPFEDWNTTEWTKIMDFDYFPNFLELMDDKAISLYRTDKHLTWDRVSKPKSQRRLLLELLQRPDFVIEDIVKRVSSKDIPYDWFIVSLYPKEREFKLEPRMFSMLVLEMRCFFACIEANIADKVFRYLPQQTMTKTKTQNQERFLSFTDPNRDANSYTLFIEIDLTRWNLRWREMTVHMIGHDLNMMFGLVNTFTITHWFFNLCQIVVRVKNLRPDGIELPDPPISNLAWIGHKGGFEGLNQKLWTAATYAMMEVGLIPLMIKGLISSYELIGQGDNQVVRLSIPSQGIPREVLLPEVRSQVNEALEKSCSAVNQVVKPEENIESTSVLTYSKDVFVQGVEYPTSLKKHSRLFPVTSQDFPSVLANVRSITAGAVAGAENSLYPLRSFIVGLYHSFRYLSAAGKGNSIHGKAYPKLTDEQILSILLIPTSIGGAAGINLASFFYKGGSDPLGKEISGLRILSVGDNLCSSICSRSLRALEEKYGISINPDLTSLIDNPYGLPLSKKRSPLNQIGDLTLQAFKAGVKNTAIAPLLSSSTEATELTLREDLITIRPLNPLLIHDLYEASGYGTIRLMKKMFIHTRTIQSVAQWVNGNITHIFLNADLNEIKSFLHWQKGLPTRGFSGKSSYALTKLFRSHWGLDLHGVNSHQPLDFKHKSESTSSNSSIKWSAHSRTDLLTSRGPLSGYLGTATREKRSEHGYRLVDTGAPSRELMKLQLIRSQAYGNAHFNDLLDQIGLTRSPVLLSSITALLPKVIGGSISHRYSSSMKQMSASYVGPLNFVTHIRVDTDHLGKISGSILNYPIMIQEFIVVAQAQAKLLHLHRKIQSGELEFDPLDLEPLPEDNLTCMRFNFSSKLLSQSPLLYSSDVRLMRTYDALTSSLPSECTVSTDEYMSSSCVFEALFGFFVVTLRDQNRAKQLADTRGYVNIPVRFRIDLPELHAIGPFKILEAISASIVYTTIRDTFRIIHLHPDRYDDALFANHLIMTCLKVTSSYWYHPLFTTHIDFTRLVGTQLRYSGKNSIFSRLEARIRRNIMDIYQKSNNKFWKMRFPVFSGEDINQITECLTTLGARYLMFLKLFEKHSVEMYIIDFVNLMNIPTSISKDKAIDLIRLRYACFSQSMQEEGNFIMADIFKKISCCRFIRLYNDDIKTVIRNARSHQPRIKQRLRKSLNLDIKDYSIPYTHCPKCLPTPKSKYEVMWDRYKYRINGGVSSAGYTWIHLLPILHLERNVAIVGSGHGGLADLLIESFNVDILALDLEKDMPKEVATLLNYHPVGLRPRNYSRFLQSDFSINTSGDWTDRSIQDKFLNSLTTQTTLFVDITSRTTCDIIDSIVRSFHHKSISVCYSRLILNHDELARIWIKFATVAHVRLWVHSISYSDIEVLVELSNLKLSSHSCALIPSLINITLPESIHQLIPQRYGQLLEAATCYRLSWSGETLDESFELIRTMCRSLLNKPKAIQLQYKDRIGLIIAYSTLTVIRAQDSWSLLMEWKDQGVIVTDLFTFKLKDFVLLHLIRYSARLKNRKFRSHYFVS